MYQRDHNETGKHWIPDGMATLAPEVRARHALARLRQALDDVSGELAFNPDLVRAGLTVPFEDAGLEGARCFALGWLSWLDGEPGAAEPLLARAIACLPAGSTEAVQAAYWLSRVRLLNGQPEAVPAFERRLRSLQGSPQAICWFVDLLWRAGCGERAEQVWKPLRANRRVTTCDEAFLQEARVLLRQGDVTAAERVLFKAVPRGGVAQAERRLLLVWIALGRRQFDEARRRLSTYSAGLSPRRVLQAWHVFFHEKGLPDTATAGASFPFLAALPLSPAASAWVRGQQARAEREPEHAIEALRAALGAALLKPFARYALACLGQDDFAALLAEAPGNFLAPRCRAWLTLVCFCRREATAADLLQAIQQTTAAGHKSATLPGWQALAQALASPTVNPAELWPSAAEPLAVEDALTRTRRRAAVEQAVRHLPPEAALALLDGWIRGGWEQDDSLRRYTGGQLLRLLLLRKASSRRPTPGEVLRAARELLGSAQLPDLVADLLFPPAEPGGEKHADQAVESSETTLLWQAAVTGGCQQSVLAAVAGLRDSPLASAVARTLLAYEAARRGDVGALTDLLEPSAVWSTLSSGPPSFLARALLAVRPAGLSMPRWQELLTHWLRLWEPSVLAPAARALAVQGGLLPPLPETTEAPAGSDAVSWFLHQASQALRRDDAVAARGWLRRALEHDPTSPLPEERARLIGNALPELERLVQAQVLAEAARLDASHPRTAAALFADLRDLLFDLVEGRQLLALALRGDLAAAREALATLATRADLPPRLSHHLALVYLRAARAFEEEGRTEDAVRCWRLSWPCWLSWAARRGETDSPSTPAGTDAWTVLLDFLFGLHRQRLKELLARGEVDRARRYWDLVLHLPKLAPPGAKGPAEALATRLGAFREDLATEYLLDTRQAMSHGTTPDGWRADYEQGLLRLRRLLSLDRDNLRLLTALIEICDSWFLDLYDTQDAARLRAEVERCTPFALQLARAIGASTRADRREQPLGELAARVALSEFFKFRGFVVEDRERKMSLYREALQLNPANANVRDLLADLEGHR
jgi:hypothetical protein